MNHMVQIGLGCASAVANRFTWWGPPAPLLRLVWVDFANWLVPILVSFTGLGGLQQHCTDQHQKARCAKPVNRKLRLAHLHALRHSVHMSLEANPWTTPTCFLRGCFETA